MTHSIINQHDIMNKIHNVDCLEFMKNIPDDHFDLVLTDPPYGIGMDGDKDWDSFVPIKEYFNEIFRVSKNQVIFGSNYFNLPSTQGIICWHKTFGFGNGGFSGMSDFELAWTSFLPKATYLPYQYVGNCELGKPNYKLKRVHPTQKPVKLFEIIIRDLFKIENNNKVFDPFMGSGTTAIACKSLGLDWCGCELEADYVAIANKRLEQVQGSLF